MLVCQREKHATIVIEIQIFRQKYIVIVNKQYIERLCVVGKKQCSNFKCSINITTLILYEQERERERERREERERETKHTWPRFNPSFYSVVNRLIVQTGMIANTERMCVRERGRERKRERGKERKREKQNLASLAPSLSIRWLSGRLSKCIATGMMATLDKCIATGMMATLDKQLYM